MRGLNSIDSAPHPRSGFENPIETISRNAALCLFLTITFVCSAVQAAPIGEVEPNDTNSTANILAAGQFAQGRITSGPEFDLFAIPNVRTNQFYCILGSSDQVQPMASSSVFAAYFGGFGIEIGLKLGLFGLVL